VFDTLQAYFRGSEPDSFSGSIPDYAM